MADPKLPRAHLGMGLALQIGGGTADLAEARSALERAVELGPDDADCWAALGCLRLDLHELDGVAAAVAAALRHGPDSPLALGAAARAAAARGATDEALQLLDSASATVPTFAEALLLRALILRDNGRSQESERALAAALEQATHDRHREALERRYRDPSTNP